MIKRKLSIINKLGLHARAAAKLVNVASKHSAEISLCSRGKSVNGKSIMGVMMLAAAKGSHVEVIANGDDEEQAILNLEELITHGFGED